MQNRNELPELLKSLNLTGRGAEIGSFKGEFAKYIAENWPGVLYMIDIWREVSTEEYNDSSNMKYFSNLYNDAVETIKGHEERCLMLRMSSEQGAELFSDKSLDFVYIDANHTYEHAKNDIRLWYPKVKKGGIFAGHDYLSLDCYNKENYSKGLKNHDVWMWMDGKVDEKFYAGSFGVNPAVDEFLEEYGYELNKTNEFTGTWWIIKK